MAAAGLSSELGCSAELKTQMIAECDALDAFVPVSLATMAPPARWVGIQIQLHRSQTATSSSGRHGRRPDAQPGCASCRGDPHRAGVPGLRFGRCDLPTGRQHPVVFDLDTLPAMPVQRLLCLQQALMVLSSPCTTRRSVSARVWSWLAPLRPDRCPASLWHRYTAGLIR